MNAETGMWKALVSFNPQGFFIFTVKLFCQLYSVNATADLKSVDLVCSR